MTKSNSHNLAEYYEHVQSAGRLLTADHARRWSDAVLKTFGLVLDRGTKKALAGNLPDELSDSLNGVFWLLHFRDPQMSSHDFQQRVARRAGNSDPEFARLPALAVFGAIRLYVPDDLSRRIADSLPPEISSLWQKAVPSRATS